MQTTIQLPDLATVRRDPGDPTVYEPAVRRILELVSRGALDGALEALALADSESPLSVDLLRMRAVLNAALGRTEQARAAAHAALDNGIDEIESWRVLAYVERVSHDLEASKRALRRALALAPGDPWASLTLATLELGALQLSQARDLIGRVDPPTARALVLLGFADLVEGFVNRADEEFLRAIELDPAHADAYLGRALIAMRSAKVEEAAELLGRAMALEPQRAELLSYWAKMLAELGDVESALAKLERASVLDPLDPTPHLYRAILLREMNRPGEALSALESALERNDNRGAYRSRLLLDRDLAIKAVDQSLALRDLGLDIWAERKALRALDEDPDNYAAHLELSRALEARGGRTLAFGSEQLIARLLSPAAVNTFDTFGDYDSLFEKPSLDLSLEASVASNEAFSRSVALIGGDPGPRVSFSVAHLAEDGGSLPGFDNLRNEGAAGILKWDPTWRDHLLVSATVSNRTAVTEPGSRIEGLDLRNREDDAATAFELGYVHEKDPLTRWMVRYSRRRIELQTENRVSLPPNRFSRGLYPSIIGTLVPTFNNTPNTEEELLSQVVELDEHQAEAQLRMTRGAHHISTGVIGHWSDEDSLETNEILGSGSFHAALTPRVDSRFRAAYIHDRLKLTERLQIEGAVYYETYEPALDSESTSSPIESSGLNLRAGAVWAPTSANRVRFAYADYQVGPVATRIDSTVLSGFALFDDTRATETLRSVALGWDHDFRQGVTHVELFDTTGSGADRSVSSSGRRMRKRGASAGVDLLLGTRVGWSSAYRYLDRRGDSLGAPDGRTHSFFSAVTFVHPAGWTGALRQSYQFGDDLGSSSRDREIWQTDAVLEYEFPADRGAVGFEIRNMLDRENPSSRDHSSRVVSDGERVLSVGLRLDF